MNAPAQHPLLKVSNLTIGFPDKTGAIKQVTHDVNLTLNAGE